MQSSEKNLNEVQAMIEEAEVKTQDTNSEAMPRSQIAKKYRSDLDVLQQEKLRTLGDSEKLIQLRKKQESNPWDLNAN